MELRTIKIPLVSAFESSIGTEEFKEALIAIVHKDGVTGYGECVAGHGPWYSEETITSANYVISQFLAPLLFKMDIADPQQFLDLSRNVRGNNMAVACVEMALWDLLGKLKGQSISRLIGGEKKEVQVGVAVGVQPSVRVLVDKIASLLADGYRRIKIKVKPGYDIQPLRAIRERFPNILLQVDANAAYSLDDLQLLKQLDEFNLLLIEQPLAHDDLFNHSKLQKQLSTPICLDESIRSVENARQAIELDACRIINIKPGRVRGLECSRQIHDLCLRRKIPVWCGGMLETGIGRAFNVALASLPGFTLPGDTSSSRNYFKEDIITPEFELTSNGTLEVPLGPGIGVQVNQKLVDSYTIAKNILAPK
ncbi:MAG: o-succinylbenzoate synthase [Candidatus Bathyarchaeia archaeon]